MLRILGIKRNYSRFVSCNKLQVVSGCDVVVTLQLKQHLIGALDHRLVHCTEYLGNVGLQLLKDQEQKMRPSYCF